MATSELEKIALGSLQLNDATNFTLESLTFSGAQKKPQFATNADADGESLVRESHYTAATFDMQIRVIPQGTADAAREKLGELVDAVQACERIQGGQELTWTPHGSEDSYTAYAITGDVAEVPIVVTGDEAGWFLNSPVAKVKLTCRPFLHTAERTVLEATESGAEPLQVVYIGGIKGDVQAEARLIVEDAAEKDRRFAQWGRDVVTDEENPALLLSAAEGLTGEGFSGESKTREGAYGSEKVLRGVAVSKSSILCGTGRIENVGSYRVYLRVYATGEAARFRITYRSGDGALIPLEWKQPAVTDAWSDIFMGEISLDEASQGTQTSEIRVEQVATEEFPLNDANYLLLLPTTKASGYARGIASNEATGLLAGEAFEQAEGNLEGKEPNYPSGIEWEEAGKTGAEGFKVISGSRIERSTVSDGDLDSGCFALLGETKHTTFIDYITIRQFTRIRDLESRIGLLGRYASTEKWVAAVLSSAGGLVFLSVLKNVSGTVTTLGLTQAPLPLWGGYLLHDATISLYAAVDGTWASGVWGTGAQMTGHDADLATGGALATGQVGVYDAYTSSTAGSRYLSEFQLMGAEEPGRVCHAGRQIEFDPQGARRQDSTGTYDGRPDSYRGAGFYLEPEGDLELINRIAVRMNRNDTVVEADGAVTDKASVEVKARERFLLPR